MGTNVISDAAALLRRLLPTEESVTVTSVARLGATNVLLWVGVFVAVAPIYYLLVATALSPRRFVHLFEHTIFPRTFANTLLYAGASTLGTVIVATLSGYAFSRFAFRGRKPLFSFVLAMMAVPFQMVALPLFVIMVETRLVDTYLGGVLPMILFPMIILLMKQNFDQLPIEDLLRSARIDGASELQILYHVVLPLVWPAIAAAAIISMIVRMGELFWPAIVFRSPEMYTVTEFLVFQRASIPAATVLVILPVVGTIYFQKHIIRGLVVGGLD